MYGTDSQSYLRLKRASTCCKLESTHKGDNQRSKCVTQLTPLCVDSARALWASFCFRFLLQVNSVARKGRTVTLWAQAGYGRNDCRNEIVQGHVSIIYTVHHNMRILLQTCSLASFWCKQLFVATKRATAFWVCAVRLKTLLETTEGLWKNTNEIPKTDKAVRIPRLKLSCLFYSPH